MINMATIERLLVTLMIFMVPMLSGTYSAEDTNVASENFEWNHEMIVELSSIMAPTKGLSSRLKCLAYTNKLREIAANGNYHGSLIESAIGALEGGKVPYRNNQYLLNDLRECEKLFGSVGAEDQCERNEPEVGDGSACESEAILRELDEAKKAAASYQDQLAKLRKQLEEERTVSYELSNELNAKQAKINAVRDSKHNCDQRYKTNQVELEEETKKLRGEMDTVRAEASAEMHERLAEMRSNYEADIRNLNEALNLSSQREQTLRIDLNSATTRGDQLAEKLAQMQGGYYREVPVRTSWTRDNGQKLMRFV